MHDYQREFINLAIQHNILRFGEFTLKSGRISPYFFNAGLFNTGSILAEIGKFYAAAIQANHVEFDQLFGPAYKGIPLVCTTAIAMAQQQKRDVDYAFNRKEVKNHGEGGQIVGSTLHGKVLIVDDVITAGTAIRESIQIIKTQGAQPIGVIVALDRQERGQGTTSAIFEVEQQFGIKVFSIIQLNDLIEYLKLNNFDNNLLVKMENYRKEYGV